MLSEVATYLKVKVAGAVDRGINRAIIDIHELRGLNMNVIKLLFQAMQTYKELAMQYALVGNHQIISECKGFEDTRNWTFFETMDQAKASLSNVPAPVPVTA